MRFLFVHRSFPGQFLFLVQALVRAGRHQIVFLTSSGETGSGEADIPGVTRIAYTEAPASGRVHRHAQDFDAAMRRAIAVAEVAAGLAAAGFQPDLIIGHEGWGETLNLGDLWPGVPQIGYREYFYHPSGADVGFDTEFPAAPLQASFVRAKNAVGLLALAAGHRGVTPTRWQRSLYPAWAKPSIDIVPDAVDLAVCRPAPGSRARPFRLGAIEVGANDRLVTFVARDLEPYRGFHVFARALPRLLARPEIQVICLGGDGASYGPMPPLGTWRGRLLAELGDRIDPSRLHFPGRVPYQDHVRLLRRSDVHAYLSYPFIVSWSLREALACGCAVVAADTHPVRELVTDGGTGVLVPPLDPDATADAILALLDAPGQRQALGARARRWAEHNLSGAAHLAAWHAVIAAAAAAHASREKRHDLY